MSQTKRKVDQSPPASGRSKRQRKQTQLYKPEEEEKKERKQSKNYAGAPVEIYPRKPIPKRRPDGSLIFEDKDFRPNLTPKECFQLGSFGGTYFRPIHSGVLGRDLQSDEMIREYPADWFEGLDVTKMVCSKVYDPQVNAYNVRCGGGLDMWEENGWISPVDPCGWFQWYCRYYLGRRTSDDERQLQRGKGVMSAKGRFRNQLIGKCARQGKPIDDCSVSPVIRQALQHWGYRVSESGAKAYIKAKKLPKLKPSLGPVKSNESIPSGETTFYDADDMKKMSEATARRKRGEMKRIKKDLEAAAKDDRGLPGPGIPSSEGKAEKKGKTGRVEKKSGKKSTSKTGGKTK
jgi:hypothetical protein